MDLPDAELWELAAAGSGEAFGQLFDRHSRAVRWACDVSPTGTVLSGNGGSPPDGGLGSGSGYVTRPGVAVEITTYGGDQPRGPAGRPTGYFAGGHVRKGVARVVITWRGLPPVTAALNGAHFMGRIAAPGTPSNSLAPATAVAYDAAGHELGRAQVTA